MAALLASALVGGAHAAGGIRGGRPNGTFTLAGVDRSCFYAPARPGVWPFRSVTGIRGSFNEVRTPVHFGVDVATAVNHAAVFAIDAGTVRRVFGDHFIVRDGAGHWYAYWHVRLLPGVTDGARVHTGQELGHVFWSYFHVHISEWVAGCGWVDPRRPTGVLHDPRNTERPAIGPLTAAVANADAWRLPVKLLNTPPSANPVSDPATRLTLDDLHGVVDLRTAVLDLPRRHIPMLTQLPLAVSAIRAFLAPRGHEAEHMGRMFVWDGARLIAAGSSPGFTPLRHLWAFGTWRSNRCLFFPDNPAAWCGQDLIYHVGGPAGFDTRSVPNGSYAYCVQALTINGVRASRCTPVVIRNRR